MFTYFTNWILNYSLKDLATTCVDKTSGGVLPACRFYYLSSDQNWECQKQQCRKNLAIATTEVKTSG